MTTGNDGHTASGSVDRRDGTAQAFSMASRISTGMVQLLARYTGRGPTKARAVLNSSFVLVILEDALTKGERSLAAAGEFEAIRSQRRTFHALMRDEAIAEVESITLRSVSAALSDISPEQGVAALLFLFAPGGETSTIVEAETETDPD